MIQGTVVYKLDYITQNCIDVPSLEEHKETEQIYGVLALGRHTAQSEQQTH